MAEIREAPQPGGQEARLLQQGRFAELNGAARLRLAVATLATKRFHMFSVSEKRLEIVLTDSRITALETALGNRIA